MKEENNVEFVGPELISWSKFHSFEFPEERWLIDNLLPLEGLVIIASPSGEKKTWFALSMAYSIASGENFLNHKDFKVQKSKVLYLDQEMSRTELQRRGKLLGFSEETENLIIPMDLSQIDFTNEYWWEWLDTQIYKHNIQVIFIDTLRAVAGGLREDKAEDVRAFFNKFVAYKKMKLCVIFLDHCRKPHPFEGKTPKKEQLLGSQDKVASIESLIMLKSEERSEEIKIYPKKSRTGIEYKPFTIKMESLLDDQLKEIAINLKFDGGIDEKEFKSEEAKEIILSFLLDGGKLTREIIEYCGTAKKIGASNVRLALKELDYTQKVHIEKRGRENLYSLKQPVSDDSLIDSF